MEYSSIDDKEILDHLARHLPSSIQPGSKFKDPETLLAVSRMADAMLMGLAQQAQKDGQELGRVEFQINMPDTVGSDALIQISDEDQSVTITRDRGAQHQAEVDVVIRDSVPETNVVTVIAGPYGNSGKWGLYTMFPGRDSGKPFPNDKQPEHIKRENQEYWDTHGFVMSNEEAEKFCNAEIKALRQASEDAVDAWREQVVSNSGSSGMKAMFHQAKGAEANKMLNQLRELQGVLPAVDVNEEMHYEAS
ncbi:MAG: hypothetical protein ACLFR0_03970 [Alphaproteobacteria bacterium]